MMNSQYSNKLSKSAKRNLRKKMKKYAIIRAKIEKQVVLPIDSSNNQSDTHHEKRAESAEIFYDSKKHKTQSETCKSTKDESKDYINYLWKSEGNSQFTTILDPKFTFLERFLQKRLKRQIVKHLLNQNSLPSDVVKPNTYSLKLETLSNSQLDILSNAVNNFKSIPNSKIPEDFMQLLELEVFKSNNQTTNLASNFVFQEEPSKRLTPEGILRQQTKKGQLQYLVKWECYPESEATWESADRLQKEKWKQFAHWACFFIGPKYKKQFHSHCKHLWSKINHAYSLYSLTQNKLLENNNISETFKQYPDCISYII